MKHYTVEMLVNECRTWLGDPKAIGNLVPDTPATPEESVVFARWFAERLLEVLGHAPLRERQVDLDDTHLPDDLGVIRYAKELDSFEYLGTMIPRQYLRQIAVMFFRKLDEAEQLNFTCPQCFAEQGFFEERGFERCKKCGYPSQ